MMFMEIYISFLEFCYSRRDMEYSYFIAQDYIQIVPGPLKVPTTPGRPFYTIRHCSSLFMNGR